MEKFVFDLQCFANKAGYVYTGDIDSQSRLEVDVSRDILNERPTEDPFFVILGRARKGSLNTMEHWWYDEAPRAWWGKINYSSGYAASATSMVMADASMIAAKDVIKIPRTGEEIFVGAVDYTSNTLSSLIRGYGQTAAAAIVDQDWVLVMPNAMEENSDVPEAISTQPIKYWNQVQTYRTPVKASNDASDVDLRAGDSERTRLRRNALFQHRLGLERAVIFGERKDDYSTNRRRKQGGIMSFLSTNVFDLANSAMTELDFENICEQSFRFGSRDKLIVCSSLMGGAINQFAAGRIQTTSGEDTYGLKLNKYQSFHGNIYIVTSRTFENYYSGMGLILDMKYIKYLTFKDTKLRPDIGSPSVDGWIDEYMTKFTTEVRLEKAHGIIKNMKTA